MLPIENPVDRLSLTPLFPTYKQLVKFIHAIQGELYSTYRGMDDEIWEHVGNPQETVDWKNPDEWIPIRLNGEKKQLALKIWQESNGVVNPRYTRGCLWLTQRFNLVNRNSNDTFELTSQGNMLLADPEGEVSAAIDQKEAVLIILQLVAEHGPCKRGEILPGYIDYCLSHTTFRAESVHKSSLHDRLVNLMDRNLVERNGSLYNITDAGINRLKQYSNTIVGRAITTEQTDLQQMAQSITKTARETLSQYLTTMNPYKFEHLIKLLLEDMGYENVEVTSPSNDGGVDVVADIELGITSVREVIQVKRHKANISRKVLDELRGSLHRFRAMRGTIITTGKFSSGAKNASMEQGAAPITLIDGDKLLELLLEHEIGISKKSVDFFEFDNSKLIQFEENIVDGAPPQ